MLPELKLKAEGFLAQVGVSLAALPVRQPLKRQSTMHTESGKACLWQMAIQEVTSEQGRSLRWRRTDGLQNLC